MTEREVLNLLKRNGWVITEGKKHHLATNPDKQESKYQYQDTARTSQWEH